MLPIFHGHLAFQLFLHKIYFLKQFINDIGKVLMKCIIAMRFQANHRNICIILKTDLVLSSLVYLHIPRKLRLIYTLNNFRCLLVSLHAPMLHTIHIHVKKSFRQAAKKNFFLKALPPPPSSRA